VREEFGEDLCLIDGGACEVGLESTILDLSRGAPVLLRPGGVTREDIAAIIGDMPRDRDADAPRASGTLAAHYAPRTALCRPRRRRLRSGDRRAFERRRPRDRRGTRGRERGLMD
jgi:hypothetical protein